MHNFLPKNEMLRLGLILFIITFSVALILSIANAATEDRIIGLAEKTQEKAMKQLIPEADKFEIFNIEEVNIEDNNQKETDEYNLIKEVYIAKKTEETIAYCIKIMPMGYGGPIDMMVGIDNNNKITGISITSFQETPGLGAKAKEAGFKEQFKGKERLLKVIKSGKAKEDEVTAISGATMTSDAITLAVNTALKYIDEKIIK